MTKTILERKACLRARISESPTTSDLWIIITYFCIHSSNNKSVGEKNEWRKNSAHTKTETIRHSLISHSVFGKCSRSRRWPNLYALYLDVYLLARCLWYRASPVSRTMQSTIRLELDDDRSQFVQRPSITGDLFHWNWFRCVVRIGIVPRSLHTNDVFSDCTCEIGARAKPSSNFPSSTRTKKKTYVCAVQRRRLTTNAWWSTQEGKKYQEIRIRIFARFSRRLYAPLMCAKNVYSKYAIHSV